MNIVSVSNITKYIKNMMQDDMILRNVYIRGEISNFKCHYSGHCYFTLKDADASIKAVMFKSKASLLKFLPTNGMKVVAGGSITVFERDGQYQLYINTLLPEGTGELSIAFEQLKEKLAQEGLFERDHKQPLPKFPKKIGIVTSATGAVLRDIYTVSKRRNPNVKLILYPVQVQGIDSARQIASAIEVFNRCYAVDVLIVGRGGGSIEDLWAFNEEIVVRAIYQSQIPVVSAVGHETDYTLTDFVSDVRAATPSQAAELIVPDVREMSRYVKSLCTRLETRTQFVLTEKYNKVERLQKNKVFQNPKLALNEKRQMLDYLVEKMNTQTNVLLLEKKHKLTVLMEKLEMLNPLKVIHRGYGLVKSKGKIVSSVHKIEQNEAIDIIMEDGTVSAIVTTVKEEPVRNVLFK